MWNNFLYTLATPPSGFPKKIDVPQSFLAQIDTPLCIWAIRILLIAAFVVCLLYARCTSSANEDSVQEKQQDTQNEQGEGGK